MNTLRVLGVEIGSKSGIYSWMRGEVPAGLHTLCPGVIAEDVSVLTVYFRALRFFSEQQVEVVFIPSYWPARSLALFVAARNAGAKVLMMNESHAHTAKAKWINAWIKRWLVRQFDGALVGGTPHKAYFTQLGMNPEKIVTGYDAVDNDYFIKASAAARANADQVRAKHGLPHRYFLNVGRMVWKKNLEVLVDAYKQVREKLGAECPRLVLVGSGDMENTLRTRCLALGLSVSQPAESASTDCQRNADVYFLGFKQVWDLPEIYALGLAFILPSREEEWGLVVNESMACGLPVVVSRVAGCAQDLVRQGENGFLFDPFDANELAGQLQVIAEQPELAANMGHSSQSIIADWGCNRFAEAALQVIRIAFNDHAR